MATKKSAAPEPTEPEKASAASDEAVVDEQSSESSGAVADDTATEAVVAEPAAGEPATAEPEAVDVAVVEPAPQVIVVDAPLPPKKRGNRGLGVALAFVAALIFAALLAGVAIVLRVNFGSEAAPALNEPRLYFPAIFFFIGLLLVTIVLNRAGWWSHIIGSVIVAAIVWFGSAGLVLVYAGVLTMTQSEANAVYFSALFSPIAIVAALLAREVSIWTGAILARRGRTLKVRNAEARANFEREKAELVPTADRATSD